MKERSKLYLPTVLSVESLNSVHHFNLTGKAGRGELHDFYELVLVEDGFYYVILDGEHMVVPPGSCVFFAPNAFHSGDGVTEATATVSIVSFDCASPAMRYFDNRIFALTAAQQRRLHAFFAECLQLCRCTKDGVQTCEGVPGHRLQMLKGMLELCLLELYREEEPPRRANRKQYRKECFGTLSQYMKENLSEPLTLSRLACALSMSEASIKSLCREFCGCGPIEYLIFLRIAAAKRLIRQSGMNFTQIAEETGFGSLHYFSRVFKERTGMTPTDYSKAP
jgi:AraC-like DNA-binding protein